MDISAMIARLSEGMLQSVLIFALTLIFSLPLGLGVSFGRMSKWAPFRGLLRFAEKWSGAVVFKRLLICLCEFRPVQLITKAYISVMRGTPLMLQLMVVYFGPYYLFKVKIAPEYQFYAVIIAFSVNYAAYFAEIYRGGIESIPLGQYEAAEVLGYGKAQAFFRIILPQAVRRILPAVTNEVITLIKDTSLAFVIAYAEMFTVAKQIAAAEASVVPFIGAAVFYYVFNLVVAAVAEKAEKRFSYGR